MNGNYSAWKGMATGVAMALVLTVAPSVQAGPAADLDKDAQAALQNLLTTTPGAKELSQTAKGILVFPKIVKGGFVVGAAAGNGALIQDGKSTAYYSSAAGSFGLQAGVQSFGYALFFMNEDDLNFLRDTKGWEIGVGPSVVVVDAGTAKSFSTTTAQKGIYAFIFDQRGLMAGLGLQGSKITKIELS